MEVSVSKLVYRPFLRNGSAEMGIDASQAPARFAVDLSDVDQDFNLLDLSLMGWGGRLDNPDRFIGLGNALSVGLMIGYTRPTGDIDAIGPIKTTSDMVLFSSETKIMDFIGAQRDAVVSRFYIDATLLFGRETSQIYIDINDNLAGLDSFRGVVRGYFRP